MRKTKQDIRSKNKFKPFANQNKIKKRIKNYTGSSQTREIESLT